MAVVSSRYAECGRLQGGPIKYLVGITDAILNLLILKSQVVEGR